MARQKPFYGWAVVSVAAVVAFCSGPGQSYVFSIFLDPMIEETGFSRSLISTMYAVGTGLSAVMVMVVSRLADRYGARSTLIGIAFLLGLACFGMSIATAGAAFVVLFAALRALGQGSMPINGTLLAAQWFVRRRGVAIAMMGLGFAASNALLPPIGRALIDSIGWRETYLVFGAMVWVLVIPLAVFVVRNRPEDKGLYPDGASHPPAGEEQTTGPAPPDKRRILSSLTFWMLAVPLATWRSLSPRSIFHQTSALRRARPQLHRSGERVRVLRHFVGAVFLWRRLPCRPLRAAPRVHRRHGPAGQRDSSSRSPSPPPRWRRSTRSCSGRRVARHRWFPG